MFSKYNPDTFYQTRYFSFVQKKTDSNPRLSDAVDIKASLNARSTLQAWENLTASSLQLHHVLFSTRKIGLLLYRRFNCCRIILLLCTMVKANFAGPVIIRVSRPFCRIFLVIELSILHSIRKLSVIAEVESHQ